MKKAAWNTERLYTKEGQRIAAIHENGRIHFVDVDRGIDGTLPCHSVSSARELMEITMFAYDHGIYTGWMTRNTADRDLYLELNQLASAASPPPPPSSPRGWDKV